MYEVENQAHWKENECSHPVEIRALTHVARELLPSDIQGVGAVALGETLQNECSMRKQAEPGRTCPMVRELQELSGYTDQHLETFIGRMVEQNAATRKYPVDEVFAAAVDGAAARASFIYSRASGISPPNIRSNPGSCYQMTYILQQTLRRAGISTERRRYFQAPFFCHLFLRTTELAEPFDIDGTWQQFLPDEADLGSMPHTLILPQSHKQAAIEAHGIPQQSHEVWSTNALESRPWWRAGYDPVTNIFNAEGWDPES